MTPLKIKQRLFEARDVAHDLHLDTVSYAEHKALDNFYSSWLGLTDTFLETYYGKYGRVKGTINIYSNTDINIQNYLVALMVFLNTEITDIFDKGVDSDLDSIVAEMKQLVNKTMYLLTLK